MKQKKRKKSSLVFRFLLLLAFVPATIVAFTLLAVVAYSYYGDTVKETVQKGQDRVFEVPFPEENITLYQEAADRYEIPWTLLAAHHRIETKFSTMDPLLSPVGAEGHMQFMPCTFVGWSHPTCSGQGQGEIPQADKTNPEVIAKYGGYGVDADGDGLADPYNLEDALHSAANYLAQNGAAEGDLERAIYRYNHSDEYVEDILHYYGRFEEQYNNS
ncbi:lytic transglycosylase domain-containing protein [Planococcus sp. SIMBA_143]